MGEFFKTLDVNTVLTYSTALAIIMGVRLASPIVAYVIIYIFHKILKIKKKPSESGFYYPLIFIFTVMGFGFVILHYLELPEGILSLYRKIFRILLILTIADALTNCLEPDSTFFKKLENNTKFNGNEALNSFIGKILKVVIYIIAAFMIITDLGYNLGGLATGLGVGSAIFALAAQDFVKSLIGGFAIITDKPFEIGDFIEVANFQGTVIDITFRSTRLKAVNNAIISMPNSVIVTEYVKNWSRLENRRLDMRLRLDLNCNTETINRAIEKIKTVLKTNNKVIKESVAVYHESIESDANILFIAMYVDTIDYSEYMKIKEQVNCDILSVLERENIELVYPTQKIYTESK